MLNNELNAKGGQPGRCVFPEQETGLLLLSPQGRLEGQVRPIRYLLRDFLFYFIVKGTLKNHHIIKKRIREKIIFLSNTAR
jgi:hypothetical protein